MDVAGREVWLVIARMLWAFKMEQVPGELIDVKEYDGLSLCCLVGLRSLSASR